MSAPRPARSAAAVSLALWLWAPACGGPAGAPEAEPRAPAPSASQPVPEASSPVLAAPAQARPEQRPAVAPAPTATTSGGLAPLTAEQRATLLAGAEDPLTPTPLHYVKSNEVRHDVWFPYIRGVGGAYLGVGSDQNYTLAAAARSELMLLADIDRSVVDLHRVYEALIEASDTPEALRARFDAAQAEASAALLTAAFAGLPEPERRRLVRLYTSTRETVFVHLGHVILRHHDGAPSSWLSDPAMYAHVRALFLADRVRAMGGDLTGAAALQSAAAAARALEIPLRVVYFSNAEEFFVYSKQFVANIMALPSEPDAVVLRTIYAKDWAHADTLWAYQVQPLADFKRRLGERLSGSRKAMLKYAELDGTLTRETGVQGLSLIALPAAPE